MKLFLVALVSSFSMAAWAEEAFVTCRQAAWKQVDGSVLSFKQVSCARLEKSFFDFSSLKETAGRFCDEVATKEQVDFTAQLYPEQMDCTQESRNFMQKNLNPLRPLATNNGKVDEFLVFKDPQQAYIDSEAKRERARWVYLQNHWYCALPGQDFYARYEITESRSALILRSFASKEQVLTLKTAVGSTIYWIAESVTAKVARAENTVDISGLNGFTLQNAQGVALAKFRMTYLIDIYREPTSSCY